MKLEHIQPPLRRVLLSLLILFVASLRRHSGILVCEARIVGAAVIPHGDFAYAPELLRDGTPEREAANRVHAAARTLGKSGGFFSRTSPDLIFLSTPHGTELSNNFATYLNTNGSGFAAIGSDLHNASHPPTKVPLTPNPIALAPNITAQLTAHLRTLGQNVSGIKNFADSEPAALRWGEVVPLLFMPPQMRASSKVVVWSQPLRRYTQSPAMVPELLHVGELVARFLEDLDARVLVVISSDLAHTHLASGPYGYSNASEPFDQAIGRWMTDPAKHADDLLLTAKNLENRALSCGFTGLVMLHGMMQGGSRWTTRLLANEHPTYYGMAVGTMEPVGRRASHKKRG